MDPTDLPTIRTGLAGEVAPSQSEIQTETTFVALMRLFTKDAADVACRYATGQGRTLVRGSDMRAALMYQARLFFQQDDDNLYGRMQTEEEEMERESEEEGEEEEEEESGEECTDEESSGEESDGVADPVEQAKYASLVRNVDAIVASWPHWKPVDPLHMKIKAAIDCVDQKLGPQ